MAKTTNPIIEINGTIGGLTFVRTRRTHYVRLPRGSKKPAVCNESLTNVHLRNNIVIPPTQLVHNLLRYYAKGFKQSNLWQHMLKLVRKCRSDAFIDLLRCFEGMEANPRYPLSGILLAVSTSVGCARGVMTLEVQTGSPVVFNLPIEPDCYWSEICVLFIDDEIQPINIAKIDNGWVEIKHPERKFEVSFEIPPRTHYYVVAMKVWGGVCKEGIEDIRAMGVKVMKAGEVEEQ